MFIVLSVVYIWSVISCNTLLSKSVQIKFRMPSNIFIEDIGFGCLLQFDRCFVPNKFVSWVASLVNYKSGDIILGGRVISLTKESVHLVLGLPKTAKPFPLDSSLGKSICLSRYG